MTIEYKKNDLNLHIRLILSFKKSTFSKNPYLSKGLMGGLGELYVYKKLFHLKPKLKSGQSGYDIDLQKINKKIEVKTSTWKGPGAKEAIYDECPYWGWRVASRKKDGKPSDIKCDYLVCVGLPKNWSKPKFYLITKKEAECMGEKRHSWIKNVAKSIVLFENPKNAKKFYRNKDKNKRITKFDLEFNKNSKKFQNRWSILQ